MITAPALGGSAASRPIDEEVPATALWVLSAQIAIFLAIWFGFGVTIFSTTLVTLIQFSLVGAALLLGPRGRLGRVIVSWPLLVFFGWWASSIAWSQSQWGWQLRTSTTLPPVLAVVVAASLLPVRHLKRIMVFSFTAMVLFGAFIMLTQYPTAKEFRDATTYLPGWRGSFVHKNIFAMTSGIALLVVLSFARRGWLRRLVAALAVLFILMSRSATGAAALLVVAVGLPWYAAYRSRRGRMTSAFAFVSVLLGTMLVAVTAMIFPWLISLYGKDPTLSGRTDIWASVWQVAEQKPWHGWGIGGVFIEFAQEPTNGIIRRVGFFFPHSHNGYLELFLLLGVVGLALWLAIAISTLWAGARLVWIDAATSQVATLYVVILLLLNVSEVVVTDGYMAVLVMLRADGSRRLDQRGHRSGTGARCCPAT
ncbi:MAG: O-antigen ligase family protein [Ilumatobacteraceae bacterium]